MQKTIFQAMQHGDILCQCKGSLYDNESALVISVTSKVDFQLQLNSPKGTIWKGNPELQPLVQRDNVYINLPAFQMQSVNAYGYCGDLTKSCPTGDYTPTLHEIPDSFLSTQENVWEYTNPTRNFYPSNWTWRSSSSSNSRNSNYNSSQVSTCPVCGGAGKQKEISGRNMIACWGCGGGGSVDYSRFQQILETKANEIRQNRMDELQSQRNNNGNNNNYDIYHRDQFRNTVPNNSLELERLKQLPRTKCMVRLGGKNCMCKEFIGNENSSCSTCRHSRREHEGGVELPSKQIQNQDQGVSSACSSFTTSAFKPSDKCINCFRLRSEHTS